MPPLFLFAETSGIKSYNSSQRKVLSAPGKMVGYPASQGILQIRGTSCL